MIFQNIIAQDEKSKEDERDLIKFVDICLLERRTKQLSLAVEEEIDKWVFQEYKHL